MQYWQKRGWFHLWHSLISLFLKNNWVSYHHSKGKHCQSFRFLTQTFSHQYMELMFASSWFKKWEVISGKLSHTENRADQRYFQMPQNGKRQNDLRFFLMWFLKHSVVQMGNNENCLKKEMLFCFLQFWTGFHASQMGSVFSEDK